MRNLLGLLLVLSSIGCAVECPADVLDPQATCADICIYMQDVCDPIDVDLTPCITECYTNPRTTPEYVVQFQTCVDCFTTEAECQKSNIRDLCADECTGILIDIPPR